MSLTDIEEIELLSLLDQEDRERVSPKMEQFRSFPRMIMGARGGRGAGAKSTGFVSLLVQEANVEMHRYAMLREIQNSLEESVYELVQEQVDYLQYPGWHFTREHIISPVGSKFIFRGLKDMRSAANIKGLQKFDRFYIEEAAYISKSSIHVLLPTLFRNPGAKLLFAYNQEDDYDPITVEIWNAYLNTQYALLIEMEPCQIDNPWFSAEALIISNRMKENDPDLWEYVYGGKPQTQGEKSVISRVDIRNAMDRSIDPVGPIQIGVDVARFGDDQTVMYKRRGLKIIDYKAFRGQDTMQTAKDAWSMAGHDPSVLIVVDDTGVGGGVTDRLKEFGAKVYPFIAGANASNKDKYANAVTELWFDFPAGEADLIDDPELTRQLTGRQYDYVRGTAQKKIESKSEYKKRIGRSPDNADALLLTYYDPKHLVFNRHVRDQLAKRRARGR